MSPKKTKAWIFIILVWIYFWICLQVFWGMTIYIYIYRERETERVTPKKRDKCVQYRICLPPGFCMFLPNLGCYMGNTWILNRRCLTKIGNMINKHGIVRARQLSWKWWISTALTYHKPIPWHRATDQFRGGITVQEPISAEKYVYLIIVADRIRNM